MEIKINDSVFVRLRRRWSEEGKKRGRRSYTIPVSSFKKDFQTIEKQIVFRATNNTNDNQVEFLAIKITIFIASGPRETG